MNIPAQYITFVSCIAIGQCDFLLQWHILLSILASTLVVVHALCTLLKMRCYFGTIKL